MSSPDRVLVIGIGNPLRSDDAVGLAVADRLREQNAPGITVLTGVSDGAALLETWRGFDKVYIIDAVVSGTPPGKVHRFDASDGTVPQSIFTHFSTHFFSVADAVRLAQSLNRLPRSLVIFGVEASRFTEGDPMTPDVELAVGAVVARIIYEATQKKEVSAG